MSNERVVINLRGFCLYCLARVGGGENAAVGQSAGGTPVSSPVLTPLRNRYSNVHSIPPGERLAPFKDLCRYLNVDDVPDIYSFGDGSEPEMLIPPLCDKCHELSVRLCKLQDELQYIETRIRNTVKRVYKRVSMTCGDQRRGALRREAFQKEFKRLSKGSSLSRGRGGMASEMKKVTDLLKYFQLKILEKENEILSEHQHQTIEQGNSILFLEVQHEDVQKEADHNYNDIVCEEKDKESQSTFHKESGENVSSSSSCNQHEEEIVPENSFCPSLENLRYSDFHLNANGSRAKIELEAYGKVDNSCENLQPIPEFAVSTLCTNSREERESHNNSNRLKAGNLVANVKLEGTKANAADSTIPNDKRQHINTSGDNFRGITMRSRVRKRLLLKE